VPNTGWSLDPKERPMVLANMLGPDALIVLVLAVVLLFGAGQLPKLARSVGEASRELKKVQDEGDHPSAPAPLPISSAPGPGSPEPVTLTRAELDAMLVEREARSERDHPASH
jgi:TatA/E family protein of Tat protein translocase